MRRKRTEIANPLVKNVLHIIQRCVRQGYFLDDDLPLEGKFGERRNAVLQRLRTLASAFAIDILRFSIMSNHLHLELRNRPELVAEMSDEEVARRWLIICPGFCQALADFRNVRPERPTQEDIEKLAKDKKRIAELRIRLSSVSFFMWALSNYCAKLFNLMDGTKGHFWDNRYQVKVLLDNASVFVCALYIDLNPIRANVAITPETSEYTSAYCQIQTAQLEAEKSDIHPAFHPDSFLARLRILDDNSEKKLSELSTRCSDLGFLDVSSREYLIALDIAGRIIREGKSGAIPADLPPIFERLNLSWENAIELICSYEQLFKCFVGTPKSLERKAAELGGHKLHCPAERKNLFSCEKEEQTPTG